MKKMPSDLCETIQYHIECKMLMTVERKFDGEIDSIHGFPIMMSTNYLLMTVINDFHDEGFTILRLIDISDAYSKENDAFYEKICIAENIGLGTANVVHDVTDLSFALMQLKDYRGFISIECENQVEKGTFYLGKIETVETDGVFFQDIDVNGTWDDETHKILFNEITRISYGDNYAKVFYRYVEEK